MRWQSHHQGHDMKRGEFLITTKVNATKKRDKILFQNIYRSFFSVMKISRDIHYSD